MGDAGVTFLIHEAASWPLQNPAKPAIHPSTYLSARCILSADVMISNDILRYLDRALDLNHT